MSALLASVAPLAIAYDPAEEGGKVVLAMLIVGFLFVGVVALGQLTHWARGRRRHLSARRRPY